MSISASAPSHHCEDVRPSADVAYHLTLFRMNMGRGRNDQAATFHAQRAIEVGSTAILAPEQQTCMDEAKAYLAAATVPAAPPLAHPRFSGSGFSAA